MSAQWAVGEAEMRRTSQPKRAMRPLQGSSATIEVAEEPLRLSPSHLFPKQVPIQLAWIPERDPLSEARRVERNKAIYRFELHHMQVKKRHIALPKRAPTVLSYDDTPPDSIKKSPAYASDFIGIRRRPTLPDRCQSSTIGTEELNFCVRYGNRWNLFVIATGNCELFRKSLS